VSGPSLIRCERSGDFPSLPSEQMSATETSAHPVGQFFYPCIKLRMRIAHGGARRPGNKATPCPYGSIHTVYTNLF
jgi:hypothetical protein